MSSSSKETKKESLETFELSNKPTLIITEKLKKQIDWLHNKVGNYEWSGELITREEGTINDLDNWKIYAEDIYIANVGSPGYTEYNVGEAGFDGVDIVDMYEKFPGLLDGSLKNHHIHSHHNMSAFFSGTDDSQLNDRSLVSNYLLMLIVNFAGNYVAKVAFKANVKNEETALLEFANNADGLKPLKLNGKPDREVLVVMKCKIEMPNTEVRTDEWFEKRFIKVKDDIAVGREKNKTKAIGFKPSTQRDLFSKEHWDDKEDPTDMYFKGNVDDYEFESGVWVKKKKKDKRIGEMSEKEWKKEQELQGIKFDLRHARMLLNNVIKNQTNPNDFSDTFSLLMKKEKELKSKLELDEFIQMIEWEIDEKFGILFPDASDVAFVTLLETTLEYLKPFKYVRIVEELIEAMEYKISYLTAKVY